MKPSRFGLVLVGLGLMLTAGCKPASAPDDASLTAAVQSRISADTALTNETIQTSVQSGVVTLTGSVSNPAARSLAANDASQIAGVRTVVNNLNVAPAPIQAVQAPPPVIEPAREPSSVRSARKKPRVIRPSRAEMIDQPSQARASHPAPPPSPAPDLSTANNTSAAEPVSPPPPPPPPPAPVTREITLAAGTMLPVRITQTLDSATTQQGQSFSGTIASDVLADGSVVLPQGSAVSGRVEAVQEAAHFKGNSLLSISLTNVSRRGARIPVTTDTFSKEGNGRGKNTAEKVGGGAAVGAILGGIFGGGKGAGIGAAAGGGLGAGTNAITRGQQVQIPSETLVRFRLTNAVMVRVNAGDAENEGARKPLD